VLCPDYLSENVPVLKTTKDSEKNTIRLRRCEECSYVFVTKEKLNCSVCGSCKSMVRSTKKDLKTKRFRKCLKCTNKYVTLEVIYVNHLWGYYVELYS